MKTDERRRCRSIAGKDPPFQGKNRDELTLLPYASPFRVGFLFLPLVRKKKRNDQF